MGKLSLSLVGPATKKFLGRLKKANAAFAKSHPGDSGARQPVHTVYGGAHLFKADSAQRLGQLALKALEENAPTPAALTEALGTDWEPAFAETVYARAAYKLASEPVEDFRIDFEDGYGLRPDAEEDHHAALAAEELAKGHAAGTLPPFIGIRIKPLTNELHGRSLRTLDAVVTGLAKKSGGRLPPNFVVTLPKVTVVEQVEALADLLGLLEKKNKLKAGTLALELMIETPQSVLGPQGPALQGLVRAAKGRCVGAHFGTYDYTASCDITAAQQRMGHPACDFAKEVMQVALAGTGVHLSDGATNVMPVGPREAVHRAWRLHYQDIRRSLEQGYYQGWDLHPAQLPTRYAAVYAFFLEGLKAATERLRNFVDKAAQATLLGEVFDDAATGQGLLNYFLRALSCKAITGAEAQATGLSPEDFLGRSFLKILAKRRGGRPPAALRPRTEVP